MWSHLPLVMCLLASYWLYSGVSWQKTTNYRPKMMSSLSSCEGVLVRQMQWQDTFSVCRLASQQFSPHCQTPFEFLKTNLDIVYYISLKLWAPGIFGHTVFGAIHKPSRKLVGFVDFSMQNCGGSLSCLQLTMLSRRQANISPRSLQPYLSNLLVSQEYRRQGIGQLLLQQCIEEAKKRRQPLHLHVQTSSLSALALYTKNGFKMVTDSALSEEDGSNIVFMRTMSLV